MAQRCSAATHIRSKAAKTSKAQHGNLTAAAKIAANRPASSGAKTYYVVNPSLQTNQGNQNLQYRQLKPVKYAGGAQRFQFHPQNKAGDRVYAYAAYTKQNPFMASKQSNCQPQTVSSSPRIKTRSPPPSWYKTAVPVLSASPKETLYRDIVSPTEKELPSLIDCKRAANVYSPPLNTDAVREELMKLLTKEDESSNSVEKALISTVDRYVCPPHDTNIGRMKTEERTKGENNELEEVEIIVKKIEEAKLKEEKTKLKEKQDSECSENRSYSLVMAGEKCEVVSNLEVPLMTNGERIMSLAEEEKEVVPRRRSRSLSVGPTQRVRGPSGLNKGPSPYLRGFSTRALGPGNLNRGPSRWTLGPAGGTLGPSTVQRGPANISKGKSCLERGSSFLNKGPNYANLSNKVEATGPGRLNEGPSCLNVGPSNQQKGPSTVHHGPGHLNKGSIKVL